MAYAQTTEWREAIAVINFQALISPESLGELSRNRARNCAAVKRLGTGRSDRCTEKLT